MLPLFFLKFNTLILLVFFMSEYFLALDQSVKGLPVGALKPFMVKKKKIVQGTPGMKTNMYEERKMSEKNKKN